MNSPHAGSGNARYLWPATLRFPTSGGRLVYLDLNHWIALAKALSGHHEGRRDRDILERLLHAVERAGAVFPLSLPIYVEVMKIREHRRRSDLRKVIERLSGFAVVTSRHVITTHEIEALLDDLVGPNPDPINPMAYLDWGAFRALGMNGGIKVVTREGEDVSSAVRHRFSGGPDEFDSILNEGIVNLNREVLEGPSPQDELDFRAKGYRPDRILERYVPRSRGGAVVGAPARRAAPVASRQTARRRLGTRSCVPYQRNRPGSQPTLGVWRRLTTSFVASKPLDVPSTPCLASTSP